MVIMSKKKLEQFVSGLLLQFVKKYVPEFLHALDPKKSYIVVLPTTFPEDDVRSMVETVRKADIDTNIIIVRADNVRIVEFE